MTTFFQLAEALHEHEKGRVGRMIELPRGAGEKPTPSSAMFLNPVDPCAPARRRPEAANDNRPHLPMRQLG